MKRDALSRTLVMAFIGLLMCTAGFGQEPPPSGNNPPDRPVDFRGNALRQLGLSPEQRQRIQRLNMERKPRMDDAQRRLRQANRALDEIIYSDNPSEAEVHARLKDFHAAQADVARIRFMGELAVRNVLTPGQLTRFRVLRQRFEQVRQNAEERPNGPPMPHSGPPAGRFDRPPRRTI